MGIRESGELGLRFRELYSGGTDPINITLPQLQSIEGHLEFRSIYSTLNILIPQLQTIGRDFRIKTSRRITSIALPQLQSDGGIFEFGKGSTLLNVSLERHRTRNVGNSMLVIDSDNDQHSSEGMTVSEERIGSTHLLIIYDKHWRFNGRLELGV